MHTPTTTLAADVAALLPKRLHTEWTVSTAHREGHPDHPATRLADGQRRFLLLLTDSGRTTLTAPALAADTSLTVDGSAPTAVPEQRCVRCCRVSTATSSGCRRLANGSTVSNTSPKSTICSANSAHLRSGSRG